MNRLLRSLLPAVLAACPLLLPAQQAATATSDDCSLPEPPLTANRPNLFNEQQEQWLGDVMADEQEADYALLPEKDSAELTSIGQRLLAQLPPSHIQYHFRVYEASELNGFSLAGGYVYISRKMLVDAKSEDEIAGVLAHEIGHIYTHQIATEMSRRWKALLNVTSVGDRNDVYENYQRMLVAKWKEKANLDESEQEKDELRADAVGLYAMVKAGYAPRALATNLERIADSKGRNGNVLSDILGGTSAVGLRVRVARKVADTAPAACKQRELKSSPEFLAFQKAMTNRKVNTLEEATPGLKSMELEQPMRPGLNWVRFSPDGKYVLAQNETYVFVMRASPLELLFKIYAPSAGGAHFTLDSKHVVFHYQSLRVEDWDVETKQMSAAHELVEYHTCDQSELSPDGKILACILQIRDAWQLSLELFDVATGKMVYSKENAFQPDTDARIYKILTRPDWDPEWLAAAFSPDSHYLMLAGIANNFAVDLTTLKPVKLGLDLGRVVQGRMLFASPDRLLYDCDAGQREIFKKAQSNVCLVEFPSGKPLLRFTEGWESLAPVAQGNAIVAGTMLDSIPHLVDLATGKPSTVLRFPAADVFGTLLASESSKGGVTVGELGAGKVQSVELPAGVLPYVRTVRFSDDGRYLALANENRGAIWDLASNHQIALTRSFRGAWFDGAGSLFLQFPPGQARTGQNLRLDLKTGAVADAGKFEYFRRQLLDVTVEQVGEDMEGVKVGDVLVYDSKTGNLLWKRHFSNDSPVTSQSEPGVLLFTWQRTGETGPDETVRSSVAVKTADLSKDEHVGAVTEMVNSQTGAVLRQVVSPLNETTALWGDLLVMRGKDNNSAVYNAATGTRVRAFWGRAAAADAKLGLVAVTNRDQELVVYELAGGKEAMRATLDSRIEAAKFVAESRKLLVLTATQKVYTFDMASPSPMNTATAAK
jgi:predicted Zn-dependent protease